MVIKTGLESLIAGAIALADEDNDLMMLICLGISGTVSPLFVERMEVGSESVFGDDISRMVDDDDVVESADLPIERRITRALFVVDGGMS